jgi:hypothetical protein
MRLLNLGGNTWLEIIRITFLPVRLNAREKLIEITK